MSLAPVRSGFTATIRTGAAAQKSPCFDAAPDRIVMDLPGFDLRVDILGEAEIQRNPQRSVAVLLHGVLWGGHPPPDLVEQYARKGIGFVRDLEGSFALLVADGERGDVWLATDRTNSHHICIREREGIVEVASELARFAAEDVVVDPVGLAWYLTNGVVHGERTILAGIRRMRRAVWQRFDAKGSRPAETYWTPEFTSEYAGRERADVKRELAELLVESVRRTVPEGEPVHVSFSAGYDVAGIAGLLARRPNRANIHTFSYGLNADENGSDAWTARRAAERHGFTHRFFSSHDGDVRAAIERNASWCDGQAQFCDESLAWFRLREELGPSVPWLCVGDQFFGGPDMETPDTDGMIDICSIRRLRNQPWLKAILSAEAFHRSIDQQEADIAKIVEHVMRVGTIQDARAFLYLDQKLPTVLMSWRERFSARAFRVINPWLSNALLEFLGKIPHAWRVSKNLYKETISALLPETFAEPRSSFNGYVPDWQMELWHQRGALGEALLPVASSSPLDAHIDPGIVRRLLARCAPTFDTNRAKWRQITRDRLRFAACTRLGLPPEYSGPLDAQRTAFLLRYLTLRRFLEIARGPVLPELLQKEKNR